MGDMRTCGIAVTVIIGLLESFSKHSVSRLGMSSNGLACRVKEMWLVHCASESVATRTFLVVIVEESLFSQR